MDRHIHWTQHRWELVHSWTLGPRVDKCQSSFHSLSLQSWLSVVQDWFNDQKEWNMRGSLWPSSVCRVWLDSRFQELTFAMCIPDSWSWWILMGQDWELNKWPWWFHLTGGLAGFYGSIEILADFLWFSWTAPQPNFVLEFQQAPSHEGYHEHSGFSQTQR